jgi:hypothetical protein
MREGGDRIFLTYKIIYRKIFRYQNHMLIMPKAKQGRWVYEESDPLCLVRV